MGEGGREGGRGGNSLHLLPAVWSRMWVVQIWVLLDMNEAKPMAQLIWKSEYRQKYCTAKNNKYSISFSSAAVYLFEEESASEVSCAAIYCKVMYKYSWVFRGVHFSFFVLTENSRLFQRFLRVISSKYETKIKGTKSVFVPKVKLNYNADDFLLLELIFSYCILLYMKYFFLAVSPAPYFWNLCLTVYNRLKNKKENSLKRLTGVKQTTKVTMKNHLFSDNILGTSRRSRWKFTYKSISPYLCEGFHWSLKR